MSFEYPGAATPVETTCRYGTSRLLVRGPRRGLEGRYLAFLGGSETFGRFVDRPFADLVEEESGQTCVNLGCVNAGLDAFVHDAEALRIAQGADLAVIQLPGAQNLSNRFYRVHPRRNDRFLAASPILSAIYRDVDFTEFSFNRHLLGVLSDRSADRFAAVRDELEKAWVARMRLMLRAIGRRIALLWLRFDGAPADPLGSEPLFVVRRMVEELAGDVAGIAEIAVRAAGAAGETGQMTFDPIQAPLAAHQIGPATHEAIAARLLAVLPELL